MASTTLFLALSLLLLLLSSSSSSLPSSAILDAAEILSGSGYDAMALNLELASQTLTPPRTHSLTVFAPSDASFKNHPELPLSLLRYHLLPHAFSLHSLTSLPFGANIPTLLPSHFLTVTTTTTSSSRSGHHLSINNVTVNPSPVYHDGSLVIFGTHSFFDPYFQLPTTKTHHRVGSGTATTGPAAAVCFPARKNDRKWFSSDDEEEAFSFREASDVLRSRGCSVMASLLDVQFLGLKDRPQMTLFAPVDVGAQNLSDYSSILRHHLVPCKILWSDLVRLEQGTLIRTYERGFTLNVTKSSTDDMLSVNGVPVIFPDLYFSDWLVVHGLPQVLSASKGTRGKNNGQEDDAEGPSSSSSSSSSFGFNQYGEENPAQHYHFSVFHR